MENKNNQEHLKYLFDISERRKIPAFNNFITAAEELIIAGEPSTFWKCKPHFSTLLKSDFLITLINNELYQAVGDNFYLPAGGGSEIDLAAALSNKFNLFIKVLEPGMRLSDRLYGNTQHTMVGVFDFVGSGAIHIDSFQQESPFPNEVLDHTKILKSIKHQILGPGQILEAKAAYDIFRMSNVNGPVILGILSSENIYPIRWEYDVEKLAPIRAIASSPNSSRLVYTIQMLAEIGNKNSVTALKALSEHSDHFVRWAAVQSLYTLDPEEGRILIKKSLTDVHPHVRNAAFKSIHL